MDYQSEQLKDLTINDYEAVEVFYLPSGYVSLDKNQAARRAHNLKAVPGKEGIYEITGQLCFKVGETFGTSQDLSKLASVKRVTVKPNKVKTKPGNK